MPACTSCGSTTIDYDVAAGHYACTSCGSVTNDNNMTSELGFAENAGGSTSVIGQFLSRDGRTVQGGGGSGIPREARDITLQNGLADQAHRLFKQALEAGYARGRRSVPVLCGCIYLASIRANEPYMLIDLSEANETNVYELADCASQLGRNLGLHFTPNDPSVFIHRYASQLNFGPMTHQIIRDALKVFKLMEFDWITIGRRTNGLAAAALLLAARAHGYPLDTNQLAELVKINPTTIATRLAEISNSPHCFLTLKKLREHFNDGLDGSDSSDDDVFGENGSGSGGKKDANNAPRSALFKAALQQTEGFASIKNITSNVSTDLMAANPPSFQRSLIERTRLSQWRNLLLENEFLAEILIQNTAFYKTNDYGDGDLRTLSEMSLSKLVQQIYFQLRQIDRFIRATAEVRGGAELFFRAFAAQPHDLTLYNLSEERRQTIINFFNPHLLGKKGSDGEEGESDELAALLGKLDKKSKSRRSRRKKAVGFDDDDDNEEDDDADEDIEELFDETDEDEVEQMEGEYNEPFQDEYSLFCQFRWEQYGTFLNPYIEYLDEPGMDLATEKYNEERAAQRDARGFHQNQQNASGQYPERIPTWDNYWEYRYEVLLRGGFGRVPILVTQSDQSKVDSILKHRIKTASKDNNNHPLLAITDETDSKRTTTLTTTSSPTTAIVDSIHSPPSSSTHHYVVPSPSSSTLLISSPTSLLTTDNDDTLTRVNKTLSHLYYRQQLQYNPANDPNHRLANINMAELLDVNVVNAISDALQARNRSFITHLTRLERESKKREEMAQHNDSQVEAEGGYFWGQKDDAEDILDDLEPQNPEIDFVSQLLQSSLEVANGDDKEVGLWSEDKGVPKIGPNGAVFGPEGSGVTFHPLYREFQFLFDPALPRIDPYTLPQDKTPTKSQQLNDPNYHYGQHVAPYKYPFVSGNRPYFGYEVGHCLADIDIFTFQSPYNYDPNLDGEYECEVQLNTDNINATDEDEDEDDNNNGNRNDNVHARANPNENVVLFATEHEMLCGGLKYQNYAQGLFSAKSHSRPQRIPSKPLPSSDPSYRNFVYLDEDSENDEYDPEEYDPEKDFDDFISHLESNHSKPNSPHSHSLTQSPNSLVEFSPGSTSLTNHNDPSLVFPVIPQLHTLNLSNNTPRSSSEHTDDRRGLEFATLVDQAVSEINLWREEQEYDLHDIDDAMIDKLILSPAERAQREAYWELVLARTHGISRQPKEQSAEHGEGRKKARREREAEERKIKTIDFGALGDDDFDGDESLFSETDNDVGIAATRIGNPFHGLSGDPHLDILRSAVSLPQFRDFSLNDGTDLFAAMDSDTGSVSNKRQKPNPPKGGKKGIDGFAHQEEQRYVSLNELQDDTSLFTQSAPPKKKPTSSRHAGTDAEDYDPFSDHHP